MRAKGPQRTQAQSELAESRCAGDGVSKWQPWEVTSRRVEPRGRDKIRACIPVCAASIPAAEEASLASLCKDSLRPALSTAHRCEMWYQCATEGYSIWANRKLQQIREV